MIDVFGVSSSYVFSDIGIYITFIFNLISYISVYICREATFRLPRGLFSPHNRVWIMFVCLLDSLHKWNSIYLEIPFIFICADIFSIYIEMRRATLYCTLGVKCGLVYFHFLDLFSRLNSNCTTDSHKRNFEIILKSCILQILGSFFKKCNFWEIFRLYLFVYIFNFFWNFYPIATLKNPSVIFKTNFGELLRKGDSEL